MNSLFSPAGLVPVLISIAIAVTILLIVLDDDPEL